MKHFRSKKFINPTTGEGGWGGVGGVLNSSKIMTGNVFTTVVLDPQRD